MSTDHRQNAHAQIEKLIALIKTHRADDAQTLVDECESLSRAILAFHMEAIRFRMYNVDRLIAKGTLPLPPEAADVFAEARRELESAGFHTRSH